MAEIFNFSVIGHRAVVQRLLRDSAEFRRRLDGLMRKAGKDLISLFKRRLLSGGSGVKKQTGALQKSFSARITHTISNININIESTSPYINPHMYGATIFPTASSALTIPLSSAVVGGVKRFSTPLRDNYPGQFRMIKVFGRAFLVYKPEQVITHVLKTAVVIPARIPPSKFEGLALDYFKTRFKPEAERVYQEIADR